jgi:TetR/AcrR family transcriptional repressor of lmrAB and yxaGH operons
MSRPSKHRAAIVFAASRLFRRQGYAATGVNEIAALSGAPKGSLYHYFPEGKEQIAEAAVLYAGSLVAETLRTLSGQHDTAGAMICAYAGLLVGWMEASGFRDGCPITTVLLEVGAESERIAAAGRTAFDTYREVYQAALARDGLPPDRAACLAGVAVAVLQGALVQARVARSGTPILEAAREAARLFTLPSDMGKEAGGA